MFDRVLNTLPTVKVLYNNDQEIDQPKPILQRHLLLEVRTNSVLEFIENQRNETLQK